jgi:hypothetical protein
MLKILVSAVLVAFSTAVLAQAPAEGPKPRGERRLDCSKAKDPKACEERLAKARAAHEKARRACEGKQGDARRAQIREACKDKTGEELRSCAREQRQKK